MKISATAGRYRNGLRARCRNLALTAANDAEAEALAVLLSKLVKNGGVDAFVQSTIGETSEPVPEPADYPVTVCAACLQASCWHGEFMCERSPSANVTVKMASELRALGREHPDHFSPGKIELVHGRFPAARRPI